MGGVKVPRRVQQCRKLSPYLFTDELGQLIHPDTFTKRLRKIYAAIGFRGSTTFTPFGTTS